MPPRPIRRGSGILVAMENLLVNDMGSLQDIEELVSKGVDVNAFDGDLTPLLRAVQEQRVDIVQCLLGCKADPDLVDPKGVGPLHMAIFDGVPDIVQSLIDAEANVNLLDRHGQTPMFFAPHRKACVQLGAAKADVNVVNGKGQSALHLAAHAGLNDAVLWLAEQMKPETINLQDRHGRTAVYCAAHSNLKSTILLLQEHGADVSLRPFKYLIQKEKSRARLELKGELEDNFALAQMETIMRREWIDQSTDEDTPALPDPTPVAIKPTDSTRAPPDPTLGAAAAAAAAAAAVAIESTNSTSAPPDPTPVPIKPIDNTRAPPDPTPEAIKPTDSTPAPPDPAPVAIKPTDSTPAPTDFTLEAAAAAVVIAAADSTPAPRDPSPVAIKPTDSTPAPTDPTPVTMISTGSTPAPPDPTLVAIKPTDSTPALPDPTPVAIKPTDSTPAPPDPTLEAAAAVVITAADSTPAPPGPTPVAIKPTGSTPAPADPTLGDESSKRIEAAQDDAKLEDEEYWRQKEEEGALKIQTTFRGKKARVRVEKKAKATPVPKQDFHGAKVWEVVLKKAEGAVRQKYGFSHSNGRVNFLQEYEKSYCESSNNLPTNTTVPPPDGPEALFVKTVNEQGLLEEWNFIHEDAQVLHGMHILSVNESRTVKDMQKELRSPEVNMKVIQSPENFTINLVKGPGKKLGFKFEKPANASLQELKITEVTKDLLLDVVNRRHMAEGLHHLVVMVGMRVEAANDVSGDATKIAEELRRCERATLKIRRAAAAASGKMKVAQQMKLLNAFGIKTK